MVRPRKLPPPFVTRLLVIFILLVIWEIGARFYADPLFLSPPTTVAMSFVPVLRVEGVIEAILRALYEIWTAFGLAAVAGLLLGMLIGGQRFAYLTLMPIVILLFAIPKSTVMPIFTAALGIGSGSKIAFGFAYALFPTLVTVIAAVQKQRPELLKAARAMGATRLDIARHILIPSILPEYFAGLRLAMASTLIGILLVELYISEHGIGYFAKRFALGFNPGNLFALIALMAVIAVLLNELLRLVEGRFSRWRHL